MTAVVVGKLVGGHQQAWEPGCEVPVATSEGESPVVATSWLIAKQWRRSRKCEITINARFQIWQAGLLTRDVTAQAP